MEQQQGIVKPNLEILKKDLPNATASLVLGIISIVGIFSYGFVGIVCGIIGLVLSNKDIKLYKTYPEIYSSTSFKTSNSGRICSIIGLIISAITFIIVGIALLGWPNCDKTMLVEGHLQSKVSIFAK